MEKEKDKILDGEILEPTEAVDDLGNQFGDTYKNPFNEAEAKANSNAKKVSDGFWRTVAKASKQIPQIENIVAAYYCAFDPDTPNRVRAILLARATAASVPCLRSSKRLSHGCRVKSLRFARMIIDIAPATSKRLSSGFPFLVICPIRSLPPLEFCLGTSPTQAENARPDLKIFGSGTSATTRVAMTGPTPGIVSSRWQMALALWALRILRSVSKICRFTCRSSLASGSRHSRARSGMRSS